MDWLYKSKLHIGFMHEMSQRLQTLLKLGQNQEHPFEVDIQLYMVSELVALGHSIACDCYILQ